MSLRDPSVKNVTLLAICQALSMSGMIMNMTVTALAGETLAPDPAYATLPLAFQFTATMLTTMPAALYMRHVGRRLGFVTGVLIGVTGAFVGVSAIFSGNFVLFCLASMMIGSFQGFAVLYRYAAADTASDSFRPRAISLVLAGGVVAALLGPELAKASYDWFAPIMFAGSFVAIAAVQALSLVFLAFVQIPRPSAASRAEKGRPLLEIARQPTFLVAVMGAMVGYGSMTFVMTATPLAMEDCGFAFHDSAFVIQWHAVGMFAPSFFTGSLINRFGVIRIMLTGVLAYLLCIAINFSGIELLQFFSALVLLGIGWNFLFIGGTTLLTESYRPAERAKVQGFGDFLVFSASTVAAFSSGYINHNFGWQAVNLGILPLAVAVGIALIWYGSRRRAAAA
ncbi:MFS transporter [Thalassobaculum salexigens]|uniref:MFS transporter n=1 Tax=Thalassobaculum salexigens TaxID=455360 RepID=UPI00040533D9|nr:MFS transporter [Thalassobaculum salexigens]